VWLSRRLGQVLLQSGRWSVREGLPESTFLGEPVLRGRAFATPGGTVQDAVLPPGTAAGGAARRGDPCAEDLGGGQPGEFNGGGSWDLTAGFVDYSWEFGDGETATGMTVTHLYAIEGTYEVTLRSPT